jgi:prepilin-type N-terminal cleavage/methylation domain-containing protein
LSSRHPHKWKNHFGFRPTGPGFTLIELLVVVSIISMLLAVTMSGLQSARRLARRTQCSANLRSLMFAALMYASDNDENLLIKDKGMNPYQLDLGFQQEIDKGHPDLRDMFQGYLGGFEKKAGPSPLMFCPSARSPHDQKWRRISFEQGSVRWAQGHYVIGYPYWAANENNYDTIGWDWFSETDPVFRTTGNPHTPIFSDPLEKYHFSSTPHLWAIASHTRSEGTSEFTSANPDGQNNARLDGSVDFITFTENRHWSEDHGENRFGNLEVCTYALGNRDVLFLWGGRQ